MDRRDDERVPDELKEAAEWMREARTEPTPLQLDELKQRAHRQAARRGGSGARWRIRAVTTLLVGGLMMTSLTGVVLATGGTGSSSGLNSLLQLLSNWTKPDKDPSHSQYCPPKPHSVSYTTTTSGGHHNDDDDDGDDCIPCPPKTMTAKTSGGSNHHGDDDDDGDDCDPCKSSSASSKTCGGGSHPSDPCDPCKSSSAGSKTYTSGGSHGGHDPVRPQAGLRSRQDERHRRQQRYASGPAAQGPEPRRLPQEAADRQHGRRQQHHQVRREAERHGQPQRQVHDGLHPVGQEQPWDHRRQRVTRQRHLGQERLGLDLRPVQEHEVLLPSGRQERRTARRTAPPPPSPPRSRQP